MRILNPALALALEASGWTPERRVDIEECVTELIAVGYTMNESSRTILRSFGGLTVMPVSVESQAYHPEPIRFEPLKLRWLPRLSNWENRLQISLSPLGECFEDSSLYVGDDNLLYASWDAMLQRLGVDFEDCLSTLIFAKKRGVRL